MYEERVIAVQVEPDVHFEFCLRDVTDGMRSPWNLRCGVKEFADGDQRCAENSRIQCSLFIMRLSR